MDIKKAPTAQDIPDYMNKDSYISSTDGTRTSSKLKLLRDCPELCFRLYFKKDLQEIKEGMDDSDLKVGNLFHWLREILAGGSEPNREELIDAKFHVTNKYLKDEYIKMIVDRRLDQIKRENPTIDELDLTIEKNANIHRLTRKTVLLPDLERERYGADDWATKHQGISITRKENETLIRMMNSTCKQKLWDFGGKYSREQTIKVTFKPKGAKGNITLAAKPDRIVFYQELPDGSEGQRRTIDEMDVIMKGMTFDQRRAYAEENNIRALIRDFKTTYKIEKIKNELKYKGETTFGYVFSMTHYFTILYVMYGVKAQVWRDFVEKDTGITEIISVPERMLINVMNDNLLPACSQAVELEAQYNLDGTFPIATREEILGNHEVLKYYHYMTNVQQEKPTYIDLAMGA